MDIVEFLIRIGVGAGLAGALGLEREASGKAAGLRTHSMVGLGSALFTLLSIEAFADADPSRVAAQIVSGIGFLGAGAIFRSGPIVKGLTTAAGLWAAAAVGMAAGSGQLLWATAATAIAAVVLLVLRSVDAIVANRRLGVRIEATVRPAQEFLTVRDQLQSIDPQADMNEVEHGGDSATLRFIVGEDKAEMLRNALSAMEQVVEARIIE